jgi:hypothetical protein
MLADQECEFLKISVALRKKIFRARPIETGSAGKKFQA